MVVAEPVVRPAAAANEPSVRPLIVDLDGTLIRSDLLIESAFACFAANPFAAYKVLFALAGGKARLKDHIAALVSIDAGTLPYDPAVLARIEEARKNGRPVYLASASHERYVKDIAEHLGVFDGVFATDRQTNLSGAEKARKLVEMFGERGFDYIGNHAADLPIWERAAKAIAIRVPPSVKRTLERRGIDVEHLPSSAPGIASWIKLIRVHQFAKNALVFLPLFTGHRFDATALFTAFVAFWAFSFCASSVYILNDLADVRSDRSHPTKRSRPLASGAISPQAALVFMAVLLVAAVALAASISPQFLAVLAGYYVLTTGYTFVLKRKMIIDVIALAALYTIRAIGGAVAVHIEFSSWLLVFSIFFFTALALMKRYTELAVRLDRGLSDPDNRNYQLADLSIVAALAAAAGMNAVTVFALYISSDAVQRLYSRPQVLWLACPLLMYWIGRALMMCHRRLMHDDPVVFALKDRVSLATAVVLALVVLFAI